MASISENTLYWWIAKKNYFVCRECEGYRERHPRAYLRRWRFLLKTGRRYRNRRAGKWRELSAEELLGAIGDHEVISFDIFDTLLRRSVARPVDVFARVEADTGAKGYADARIRAERQAREHHPGQEDVTLEEIYRELPAQYQGLRDAELEAERACTRADETVREIYESARRKGKRIVICSDMYLPGDFLEKLLREKGYDGYEGCFVSADVRKTKRTGRLFTYMTERIGAEAGRVLHIGDNMESDGAAYWLGMGFVHVYKDRYFLLL